MSEGAKPYHLSRLRRALVHFLTGRIVQAGSRAILVLVLVRLLPLRDYGAYMLLIGLAEMVLQVASLGILPMGRRYLPQMLTSLSAGRLYRFVGSLIGLQMLVLGLVALALWNWWEALTPWFGFSVEQTFAAEAAVILFLLMPAFRFSSELLEALLEQGKSQIARALMPAGRLLGIGALLYFSVSVDLRSIIILDIVVTGVCLALAWVFLQTSLRKLHAVDGAGKLPIREMLRFAWHMAAADLMSAAASPGAVRLALANTLGVVASGLFAFLQSLERLVLRYLPGVLLSSLVRPMLITRAFRPGGMAVVEAGSGLLLKANLVIVAAGTVMIAIAGDPLVAWASGGKFTGAGLTLLLMFLALSFKGQRFVIEMIMQITGHTSTLRATAFVAPVSLLLVWLFADRGINVAVAILGAGSIIGNAFAAFILTRSTDCYRIDWRGLAAIYAPALVAIPFGLLAAEAIHPFAAGGLATTGYAASLVLMKPFRLDELGLVEQVFGRRLAAIARVLCHGRLHRTPMPSL